MHRSCMQAGRLARLARAGAHVEEALGLHGRAIVRSKARAAALQRYHIAVPYLRAVVAALRRDAAPVALVRHHVACAQGNASIASLPLLSAMTYETHHAQMCFSHLPPC